MIITLKALFPNLPIFANLNIAKSILSQNPTITNIDNADQVPHPHERLILDMALDDDDAAGTRREQLLKLVEEHYIHPVCGSLVSVDISAMMSICTDNISELVEEIEFSD